MGNMLQQAGGIVQVSLHAGGGVDLFLCLFNVHFAWSMCWTAVGVLSARGQDVPDSDGKESTQLKLFSPPTKAVKTIVPRNQTIKKGLPNCPGDMSLCVCVLMSSHPI